MYKILESVVGIIIALFVLLVSIVCILTPEKTKHGTYTDVVKYWMSDAYLCENFTCPEKKGTK